MASRTKQALKRWIIRWEYTLWAVTLLLYVGAIVATYVLFPNVSNLTLQITLLFTGFVATLATLAGVIKTSDTDE